MNIQVAVHAVAEHFIDRLKQTDVIGAPYPHIYVTECFPPWFYDMMLAELPPDEFYTDRTFENRMMARVESLGPFWKDISKWMLTWDVIGPLVDMFEVKDSKLKADLRLVRDRDGYKIKPHTDIKAKAISLLFYLPDGDDMDSVGTSVYVPKERGFTSDGTRRYEFEDFDKVTTAPFMPNTMFGFPRSDISFHGVEPISVKKRDVLLLNVYRQ